MRQLVISEQDHIAALMEDGRAIDFYISKNEYGVGDIYSVLVENIMPSINAVFVKIADGQMGFLHANDIPGRGPLENRLYPGQRLLVQIVKEPTGNKGPRVNPAISIPGRYYVLTTEAKSINISRRINENAERDRLRSITNLMKPEELGVVIRTEAAGRSQEELEEDFLNIWEKWKNIIDRYDRFDSYGPIFKESDFLYTVIRDFFNNTIDEICVGSIQAKYRCQEFLKTWTGREIIINGYEPQDLLMRTGVLKELRNGLSNRVNLPSGGYIVIQGMEALTAIDINSGKFTSSSTLRETVRKTNMEAAVEIARQIRLRNIGGMIIVDFIDMADRSDRISVMEVLESALRPDKAKPQVGQLSDLCLAEITRKRSGQALAETFGSSCSHCNGSGILFNLKYEDNRNTNRRPNSSNQHQHQREREQQRPPKLDLRDRNDREGGRNDRDNRDRDRNDRDNRGGDRDNRSNDRNDRNNNRRPNNNQRNNNNRFNNQKINRGNTPNRPPLRDNPGGINPEGNENVEAPEEEMRDFSDSQVAVLETDKMTRSKSFSSTHLTPEDILEMTADTEERSFSTIERMDTDEPDQSES